MTAAELWPVGTLPPLGAVPQHMHAQVIRPERYGDPADAFQLEIIETPRIAPDEVLVAVMAAGTGSNDVRVAAGYPVDQIGERRRRGDVDDFHVAGCDASGIVYSVGEAVEAIRVGDHVVIHPGCWDSHDPWIEAGGDEMVAPSARIWGYDTNFGAFAQFCRVQAHQVLPKAPHLSWEEAAVPNLAGTTAYRMLFGWPGNTAGEGDVVLVWGGSGGLAGQAIQLARLAGSIPVAVVANPLEGAYAQDRGAAGWIDHHEFSHWGASPLAGTSHEQHEWLQSATRFRKRIWEAVGSRTDPAVVIEHLGAATIPTSGFVCRSSGMVAICCSTSDYDAAIDLRYHWTHQKRLQGSLGANDSQAIAYNALVLEGKIDPCLGEVRPFTDIGVVHGSIARGDVNCGNVALLIGAGEPGTGQRPDHCSAVTSPHHPAT